ncbi:MAG: PD40 domain-containing protein [Bacillaceae bacterium]|nr:PD40 domain-containing protein [Bacillaceae bacterium]
MKKRQLLWISSSVLAVVALTLTLLSPDSTKEQSEWHAVGNGNLGVHHINDGYLLYPVATTYVPGVNGSKLTEYKLGTKNGYILEKDGGNIQPVQISESTLAIGSETVSIIKVNGHAFATDRTDIKRVSTGFVVGSREYYTNIWLVSEDGSIAKPLVNTDGYSEAKQKLKRINKDKGEDMVSLVWAANPYPLHKGDKIAYLSNRTTLSNDWNVRVINSDGTDDRVLIDGAGYGGINIVGTTDNLVIAHTTVNKLIVANSETGEVKEINLDGLFPFSVSPAGHVLLMTQNNDIRVMDLKTGSVSKTNMPSGYFYNTGGDWSDDGKRFAFYANGFENIDDSKLYRDNIQVAVLDVTTSKIETYGKPPGSASLYPLGEIQWIGDSQLLTYTVNDTAWLVRVPK